MKFSRIIIILMSSLLLSCGSKSSKEEGGTQHEELPPNVVEMNDAQCKTAGIELGDLENKTIAGTHHLNGTIAVPPQQLFTSSTPLGGYVNAIQVQAGSQLKPGDIIAYIENQSFIEIQQAYLEAKNKFEYIEKDFIRQQALNKEGINANKTYQQAESEYKNALTAVKSLEQKIKMIGLVPSQLSAETIKSTLPIRSPIQGFVKSVNVNRGKYVSPTDVIAEIVNTSELILELNIFEKDFPLIASGKTIQFSPINTPDHLYHARITQFSRALGVEKIIKVFAQIQDKVNDLIPGMAVTVMLQDKEDNVSVLPSDAVLHFDDKDYIFVHDGSKMENGQKLQLFKLVEIKKGISNANFIQVILPNNFKLGSKKIVVHGAYPLLSALKNAGDMAC